jgi:hypothetical protein
MTMENGALGSYRDYPAQRRALERVLQKLRGQDFPGAPYLEEYLRHLHRRDLTNSGDTILIYFSPSPPFGPGFSFSNIRPVNCSSCLINCTFPKGCPVHSCCRNCFASSAVASPLIT